MMKGYYSRSMRVLQLAGMRAPTQKGYTRAVLMLVDFYDKTPDRITEQELHDYLLHRKNYLNRSQRVMVLLSGKNVGFILLLNIMALGS